MNEYEIPMPEKSEREREKNQSGGGKRKLDRANHYEHMS